MQDKRTYLTRPPRKQIGLVMRPMLICDNGHWADVPDVRNLRGADGMIQCAECSDPMHLITYNVRRKTAYFGDMINADRIASGTWWR